MRERDERMGDLALSILFVCVGIVVLLSLGAVCQTLMNAVAGPW